MKQVWTKIRAIENKSPTWSPQHLKQSDKVIVDETEIAETFASFFAKASSYHQLNPSFLKTKLASSAHNMDRQKIQKLHITQNLHLKN